MQHTGDNPGQYNIVKYFGQEVRQHSICLKFEFVHPNTSFKRDLNNITYPQVVTYMRQLLIALDSLHTNTESLIAISNQKTSCTTFKRTHFV